MLDPTSLRFDGRRDCEAQWRQVLALARTRLDMFDPDYEVFPLGAVDVETLLRGFFAGGGRLRLALHDSSHIERHAPRFLRLQRDYGHLIECRQTPRTLRHLTDSFTIADDLHVLRRFHSEHMRGEAAFAMPDAVELPAHRFALLWEESQPALKTTLTGL